MVNAKRVKRYFTRLIFDQQYTHPNPTCTVDQVHHKYVAGVTETESPRPGFDPMTAMLPESEGEQSSGF